MSGHVTRFRWIIAGVILIVLSVVALPGFWPNGQLGVSDWDYYFSYHEVVRRMVIDLGVFPHWNPYICGGTSGVGDPEFPLFAPTFLLELLFGIPVGLRLAIYATVAGGAIGMLMLAKRLGLSVLAALLAAIAYGFGSVNLLEVVEGHPNVFSAAYVPWVLWAWLNAYRLIANGKSLIARKWIAILALLLAAMFFQGGIYMLMYTAGAFVFLIAAVRHRKQATLLTLLSGLLALGLAAIKLIPVALWLSNFQDAAYASSAFTLPYLHEIFLGRHLHGVVSDEVIANQGSGWHEYGAYLGIVVMLLAALGALGTWSSRIVRFLVLGGAIALLISSSGPYLKPFFDAAPWFPRSNISRLILFTVIPLCLLAGHGLDALMKWMKKLTSRARMPQPALGSMVSILVAVVLVGFALYDLGTYASSLSQQAFVLPHPRNGTSQAEYPLQYTIQDNKTRHKGVDYTRAYGLIAKGYGTQSYCTVLGPEPAVKTLQHHDENQSLLQINDPDGSAQLITWSPHTVTARVEATRSSEVTLNANYAPGWNTSVGEVQDVAGRVVAKVPAGNHTLTLSYRAPGFLAGFTITVITIVITFAMLIRKTKPHA